MHEDIIKQGDSGCWLMTPGDTLRLASVGLDVAVAEFYEDADL